MLFRIEDSENCEGVHRDYSIELEDLPRMPLYELENYISNEVRKEVNGANDRRLLSYSKSLGVCLLKYNKFADNEIHINNSTVWDYVRYYDTKKQKQEFECYSLDYALLGLCKKSKKREIVLCDFAIDISNNDLLDKYLKLLLERDEKNWLLLKKIKKYYYFNHHTILLLNNTAMLFICCMR